jgi:hypothetical protein
MPEARLRVPNRDDHEAGLKRRDDPALFPGRADRCTGDREASGLPRLHGPSLRATAARPIA